MASLSPAPTRAAEIHPRRSSCRPDSGLPRDLAAASQALRASGRPARAPAHGRVPAPGTRQPRRARPPRRKLTNANSTSNKQLGQRAPEPDLRVDPRLGRGSESWPSRERSTEASGGRGRARRPGPGVRTPGLRGLPGCGQASPAGREAARSGGSCLQAARRSVRAAPARSDGIGQRLGLGNGPGPLPD